MLEGTKCLYSTFLMQIKGSVYCSGSQLVCCLQRE